jgi:O-antigen/teichoic acid export membrane protein
VPVGVAGLLTLSYGRIDQVLVFWLAGEQDAAHYGAVYRVLDQGQFVPIAVMTTLFPMISAAAHGDRPDLARVRQLLQITADFLAAVSLPVLAFTVVAAGPLVRLLFGGEFADASPALPVLMGAFVLICFGYLGGNMVIVMGLQRRFIRFAVVALVVNVAANLALVPAYGFMAAAWVTLLTEVVVLSLTLRVVLARLEMRPSLRRIVAAGAAAAAMGGAVAGLRAVGVPLGGLVVAAAAVYVPLALLGGAVDVAAARSVLVRRRARPG